MLDAQSDRREAREYPWPTAEGPYRLRVTFGYVHGRPAILGLELWGVETPQSWATIERMRELAGFDPPDAAIRSQDVRQLPLARLLDTWTEEQRAREHAVKLIYGEPTSGRAHLTDDFLGTVAAIYNAAVAAGDRRPALRVQRELGAATPATARSWIRAARKRGLDVAKPIPQGRPGGAQTKPQVEGSTGEEER